MNNKWPVHYPSVQRLERPNVQARTQTFANDSEELLRPSPRRTTTSFENEPILNLQQSSAGPRLMTPQISQDFNVLKLDLKLGALSPSELVHSLEKGSVASLLDGKISQAVKHLQALRERIEDTSSKVLVTGDLNAGKSTFCNALLRKKVLPEDQQPCTNIFCEVLDARENGHIEEVHAIPKEKNVASYNRHDEATYDVIPLGRLEDVVVENDKYSQVKIYIEDARTIDQSLLRNGVVDIALIDAPGLNLDSLKTTAVFARQEEIDVVVFVVSAENHFTLSAKEFIWNAANEKAYIFIVVNRFDNIRDKARCRRMILEQVAHLSPRTYQDAEELVHFVSSNAVIDGEELGKIKEFENLEQSLRSFVLEKRARSKLAPAKTYLINLLGDLETLAKVNKDVTQAELEKVFKELEEIIPAFEQSMKARNEVSEEVERLVEQTGQDIYRHSRKTINSTINRINEKPVVEYGGIFNMFVYAEATKIAMLDTIQSAVAAAEERARSRTVEGVLAIKTLGMHHLGTGEDYVEKAFRPEVMFRRRRDQLNKSVKTEVELFDFFDFDFDCPEKVIGGSMSLTVATVAGSQLFGVSSWFDRIWKAANILGVRNTRKLIFPILALAVVAGGAFVVSDVPNAIPRKLAKKLKRELAEMDYVHINSERISKESRKVLKFPSEDLRSGFQRRIERQGRSLEEKKAVKKESEVALKYFGNIVRDARESRKGVENVDLEGQVAL